MKNIDLDLDLDRPVRLGKAYAFPVQPSTELKHLIQHYPHRAYTRPSVDQDFLMSYYYGPEKAYLIVYQSVVYYVVAGVFYHVQCSIYTAEDYVIEGNVVENIFLLQDVAMGKPFQDRLKWLNALIIDRYTHDSILDPFQLMVADYVTPAYIQSFLYEYSAVYKRGVQGVLMTARYNQVKPVHTILPLDTPFTFNRSTNVRLTQVQEPRVQTAVFRVKKTELPDIYHLYLYDKDNNIVYYDLACVPDKITSRFLGTTCCSELYLCEYHPTFKGWKPIRPSKAGRPDSILCLEPGI